MEYPTIPELSGLIEQLTEYGRLKHEYGAQGVSGLFAKAETGLRSILGGLKELPIDRELSAAEPDDLASIRGLRPHGPRRLWQVWREDAYRGKLEGALLARAAGCTLGAMVEGWQMAEMEEWAGHTGDPFPPNRYWSQAKDPSKLRYGKSLMQEYTRNGMNSVPVDDDLAYTLLGLLIVEAYGANFTTKNVGEAWLKYLPYACTAEEVALKNLKAGLPASSAGEVDNPYCQWIGADIRSDAWAYLTPGWPEKAAEMAYHDAYLSHRRNGVYGAMFFAAAESAAFAVDDPVEALKIGLTEIPENCWLATEVRWALTVGKGIGNYREARQAVDLRFPGMHPVHTINNACLTIFGLMLGGTDLTRVLSEIVAMGLDNDCNAATAGSIVGAMVGKDGIPQHWYENFNNTICTYLIEAETFMIDELINRFDHQAMIAFNALL